MKLLSSTKLRLKVYLLFLGSLKSCQKKTNFQAISAVTKKTIPKTKSLMKTFDQGSRVKSKSKSSGAPSLACCRSSSIVASSMPKGRSFHFLNILLWGFGPGNSRTKLQIFMHIHSTPVIRAVTPQSSWHFLQ